MEESRRALPGTTSMQGTVGKVFTTLLLAGLMTLAAATDARTAGAQEGDSAEGQPGSQESPEGTVEIAYDTAEIEMVSLINDYREDNGLDPLLVSDTASLAAKRHSEDMARYGFVDHATQQSAYFKPGASFDERMDESGYGHDTSRSENIAAGGDAEETFESWRESPSHDENMLDPDMKVVGIGLATSGGSGEGRYSSYWTTDFGGHVDETATDPSEVELEPEATATENEPRTESDGADTEEQYSAGNSQDPRAAEPPEEGSTEGSSGGEDSVSEERTDPGAGGDPNSSSDEGSDETADESAADDQYSSGAEESGTEGSEGEDEEPAGDDSEGPEDSEEGRSGGSGEEGDRNCDTVADFDKGPFDEGFGSALSEHIRAKVDCQLAQASIDTGGDGGEEREGENGATTGRTGGTTIAESTTAQSSTNDEAEQTGDSEGGDGEGGSTPDQTGNQEASSGGFLAGLFGGSESAEKSQASSDELSGQSGVSSSGESIGEGSLEDESSNESSGPEPTDGSRDGATSVLGPASTDDDTGEAR